MKSEWITHKGQRIFYLCLKDFESDIDGFRAEVKAVETVALQQSKNSMLILVDVRNTVVSIEAASLMKAAAQRMQPHARRLAVIGVKGFVTVIADAIVRLTSELEQALFDDLEQAKDWLVEAT